MYNRTVDYISEREQSGDVFVFQPDKELVAGLAEHNPKRLMVSYEHGREVVKRQWNKYMEWMEIKA